MKKNTIKAFTLVEMLIVIVIIGILIAALMPRMQAAQGRARDVSRKTALSQIQSAIVVSQWDLGKWPKQDSGTAGLNVSDIKDELVEAGMNWVPKDPLDGNKVTWLWSEWADWEYRYMVVTRNWVGQWWFVLMAKTEVAGWSNWVQCTEGSGYTITSGTDIAKNITLCETVTKGDSCVANTTDCKYTTESELRYIVLY